MSACLGFVVYVDPVLDRLAGWNLVKRPVMLSCLPGPNLTGRAVTLDDLTSLVIVKMPQAHDGLAGRNVVDRPLMPYAWADLNLVMTLYGLAIRVRSQIGLNIIIVAMMFNGLSGSNRQKSPLTLVGLASLDYAKISLTLPGLTGPTLVK